MGMISGAFGDIWQWTDQSAGALGAIATIATACFAAFALVSASRDSRDRSRPYVIAEFRMAEHNDTAFDLVVRNAGVSMARTVAVTFDPLLVVPADGGPYVLPYLIARYNASLPCVAPGQVLTNVWWTGRDNGAGLLENGEPTPDEVTVRIKYRDDRGRKYDDTFPLDVRAMLNASTSTSSTSVKGRLKSIDASLAKGSSALVDLAQAAQRATRAPERAIDDGGRLSHLRARIEGHIRPGHIT